MNVYPVNFQTKVMSNNLSKRSIKVSSDTVNSDEQQKQNVNFKGGLSEIFIQHAPYIGGALSLMGFIICYFALNRKNKTKNMEQVNLGNKNFSDHYQKSEGRENYQKDPKSIFGDCIDDVRVPKFVFTKNNLDITNCDKESINRMKSIPQIYKKFGFAHLDDYQRTVVQNLAKVIFPKDADNLKDYHYQSAVSCIESMCKQYKG